MQGESAVADLAHLNLSEILPIGQAIEKFNPDGTLKISISRFHHAKPLPHHISFPPFKYRRRLESFSDPSSLGGF